MRFRQYKSWYLADLYRASKLWFLAVLIYLLLYLVSFIKKMDTVFFPYNAMFAYQKPAQDTQTVYRIRVHEKWVPFTQFPYWKKDLLETSLQVYGRYLEADRRTYLDQYLLQKDYPKSWQAFLTPGKLDSATFPAWWLRKTGYPLNPAPDSVSVWKCLVLYTDNGWQVCDSICLDKQETMNQ